jgi:hypothetical protein
MARVVLLACAAVLCMPIPATAETYKAKYVMALDGVVDCKWARDRFITVISGPCEDYKAPSEVRLGATFQANGKTKTIKVIAATQIEKDYPELKFKKGDWYCAAAESAADIPSLSRKSEHTGTWLYIGKCKPLE